MAFVNLKEHAIAELPLNWCCYINLQIIIENLVETVFEGVNHVEEAVVALYSLNNYSKRKSLKRIFKRKTAEVSSLPLYSFLHKINE